LAGLGGGRDDGGGAEAGFVREYSARQAVAHGEHDAGPGKAPGGGGAGEGIGKDKLEHRRQVGGVGEQNEGAGDEVEEDHGRDDAVGHAGNAREAAEHDGRRRQGDDRTAEGGVDGEAGLQRIRHRIALHHAADAEGGEAQKQRISHAQQGLVGAVGEVVHGAATVGAVGGFDAVVAAEQGFGIFECHAEEAAAPHPEHRPRPAQGDGGGDPSDVAGADGGGQGCHEGGAVGDGAFGGALGGEDVLQGRQQHGELHAAQQQREPNSRGHKRHQHGPTPQQAGDDIQLGV